MILLKALVVLEAIGLAALVVRHWRDRSPGPYVEPRSPSPFDKPRCRVCAAERVTRTDERDSGSPAARAGTGQEAPADGTRGGTDAARAMQSGRQRATDTAEEPADRLARDAAPGRTDEPARARPRPSDGRDGTLFVAPARRDDLKEIKGIGKVMEGKLNALGVTTFEQLAGFEREDIERVSATLASFRGRVERDRWVEQAAALARRDAET